MRITLPQGASGEVDVLREALERTFKLKARRERREVEALVLRTVSPKLKPTMDTGLGLKGLAEWLERRLKQPVVDETNLAGRYDIDLALDPEQPGALEKTLGLKLEPAKRPMEFLVVESGNLPAPIGIQI